MSIADPILDRRTFAIAALRYSMGEGFGRDEIRRVLAEDTTGSTRIAIAVEARKWLPTAADAEGWGKWLREYDGTARRERLALIMKIARRHSTIAPWEDAHDSGVIVAVIADTIEAFLWIGAADAVVMVGGVKLRIAHDENSPAAVRGWLRARAAAPMRRRGAAQALIEALGWQNEDVSEKVATTP